MHLHTLIGAIYESVEDTESWGTVADGMSKLVGAHASWLWHPRVNAPAIMHNHEIPEGAWDLYAQHFHEVDILVQVGMRRYRGLTGVLRDEDIVTREVLEASELYNDWCLPAGVGSVLTAPLTPIVHGPQGPVPPAVLTFYRPPGADMFSGAEVALYEQMLPHLRRAVRLNHSLACNEPVGTERSIIDGIPHPALLLSAGCTVLHANPRAEAMLLRQDAICLRGGRLCAAHRPSSARFAALLASCLTRQPGGRDMELPRQYGQPLLATAMPLASSSDRRSSAARICLILLDVSAKSAGLSGRLIALFRLTAAEARVATALADGSGPAEIAVEHEVSLHTVRTQIAAVYAKFGVRRQGELLRLLHMIAGSLHRYQ